MCGVWRPDSQREEKGWPFERNECRRTAMAGVLAMCIRLNDRFLYSNHLLLDEGPNRKSKLGDPSAER